MAGKAGPAHRIRATIGDIRINGDMYTSDGRYSLRIPHKINNPSTRNALSEITRAGAALTVQYKPYAKLGANISWLRSGYLALFAVNGYKLAFDPAMEIVRRQILECDERKMVTFISVAQLEIPLTERRILRVLAPEWHRGWAVQFGRYFVQFPSPGDISFYDRLEAYVLNSTLQGTTTYQNMGSPNEPTFGIARKIEPAV